MDDGEVSCIVERLEGVERRMQTEEAVKVYDLFLRDRDAGAHRVIVLLAPGNDDVEAVGGSALEDDHETATGDGGGFGEQRAHEKAGDGCCAGKGQCALVEKESAIAFHRWPPVPRGLKPRFFLTSCSARLKSCPD